MHRVAILVWAIDLVTLATGCGEGTRSNRSVTELRSPSAVARCGRLSDEELVEVHWRYGTDNESCNRLETAWRNVPHLDRTCHANEDCVAVPGLDGCVQEPLNRSAARKPEYRPRGCGNPAAGVCLPPPISLHCVPGCCERHDGPIAS